MELVLELIRFLGGRDLALGPVILTRGASNGFLQDFHDNSEHAVTTKFHTSISPLIALSKYQGMVICPNGLRETCTQLQTRLPIYI